MGPSMFDHAMGSQVGETSPDRVEAARQRPGRTSARDELTLPPPKDYENAGAHFTQKGTFTCRSFRGPWAFARSVPDSG